MASGLWYIGSTTETLRCRRFRHFADAHSGKAADRKFYKALLEHDESDWEWLELIDIEIPEKRFLHIVEAEYQRAFDSVQNGFNTNLAANTAEEKVERARKHRRKRDADPQAREHHLTERKKRRVDVENSRSVDEQLEINKRRRKQPTEDQQQRAWLKEQDPQAYNEMIHAGKNERAKVAMQGRRSAKPEAVNAINRKYGQSEKGKETTRLWREANRELINLKQNARRRAKQTV